MYTYRYYCIKVRLFLVLVAVTTAVFSLPDIGFAVNGQTCSACPGCTQTARVYVGFPLTLSTSLTCPAGYSVQVTVFNILSDDGSKFIVQTGPTSDSTIIYPALSSSTSSPCFYPVIGPGINTAASSISVIVSCKNIGFPCPIHYYYAGICVSANPPPPVVPSLCASVQCGSFGVCNTATGGCICNSGYSGTLCTIPPVPGKCNCHCCIGGNCVTSATGDSCSAGSTNCDAVCINNFPSYCPAPGVSGTLSTICASGSTSSSSSQSSNSDSGGLSSGTIAGIVIAVIVGLLIVIGGGCYLCRSSQDQEKAAQHVVQMQKYQQRVYGQQLAQQRMGSV